ncbi:MAG: beta-N-acetylhexosaminidase [Anaerolineae bacterium]
MRRKGWLIIIIACVLLGMPARAQTTVERLLDEMTLEQKVAQMFVMSFYGSQLNEPAGDLLTAWQPGAVVLLPSNLQDPSQITRLTNDIQQSLIDAGGVPAFIAVDQEGGIIAHLEDGFTVWPVPSLLTATQNLELAQQVGQAFASEMLAVGINMNLAPVADLQTNPDNPIIGRRAFGNDPQMVAPMVAGFVQGMQAHGVLATLKHFPGHGDTDADSHLELPIITADLDQLWARELQPFRAGIEAGAGAIMTAHIHFSQIDMDAIRPASLSSNVIQGLLRDELGHQGLVITDALDMDAIDTIYSPAQAALNAIIAGNDLILLGAHISPDNQAQAMQAVVDSVRTGTLNESRINQSVRRILQAKAQYNVLDWHALDALSASDRIDSGTHAILIDRLFQQGITQVHDEGDLFPLTGRTLMIYPAYRGTLGLACSQGDWQFAAISLNPDADTIRAVADSALYADNVLVFTENMVAHPAQAELVRALPAERTAVIALWSPFDALHMPAIASYWVTYSPLPQAYEPLCDMLHGEIPTQGQLSVNLSRR